VQNFEEAVAGFSAEDALEESQRCLRCDIRDHH
jgi:NADPH-dependent glutamate synthase beta subunit-like oxidoreductase